MAAKETIAKALVAANLRATVYDAGRRHGSQLLARTACLSALIGDAAASDVETLIVVHHYLAGQPTQRAVAVGFRDRLEAPAARAAAPAVLVRPAHEATPPLARTSSLARKYRRTAVFPSQARPTTRPPSERRGGADPGPRASRARSQTATISTSPSSPRKSSALRVYTRACWAWAVAAMSRSIDLGRGLRPDSATAAAIWP